MGRRTTPANWLVGSAVAGFGFASLPKGSPTSLARRE
jgi:hypothetical protein